MDEAVKLNLEIFDKVEEIGELRRTYNELKDKYSDIKRKYREKHLIEKYLRDNTSKE